MSLGARGVADAEAAQQTRSGRAVTGVLVAAALGYALLYLAFWPPIFSTIDESSYLGMAYVLRQGTIYPDEAGVFVATAFPAGEHIVSKYPLGMPALLALTSFFGWPFALGTNLLVHLLTFFIVARLLHRVGASPLFALLFLFHPTAIIYSRTVMADSASGLLLALSFYCFLNRRYAWVGILVGVSVLLRTANVFALPVFALAVLLRPAPPLPDGLADTGEESSLRGRLTAAILMSLASLPFLGLAAYYMVVVTKGLMAANTGSFGAQYFPQMFPFYVLTLMLLWPGMLLAPLIYRGPGRLIIAGISYGFILLYSFWYYRDQGGSTAESLIVGQRYFLAVLPLLIVAYGKALQQILGQRLSPRVVTAVAAAALPLFLVATFAINRKHSGFLAEQARVRDVLVAATAPEDIVYAGMQAAKLLHPAWGGKRDVRVVPSAPSAEQQERFQREILASLVQTPERRIVLASWARPGRADEAALAKEISSLGEGLSPQSVSVTPAPLRLPESVVIQYIAARRHAPEPQPQATASAGQRR